MERIKRRVGDLFYSRRGFLWHTRAEWRLRVIFQRQSKEPRLVLTPQFRSDAKAEINSCRDAAGGNAIAVFNDTVDDKLCSKLRQKVTHRPVRRRLVTT